MGDGPKTFCGNCGGDISGKQVGYYTAHDTSNRGSGASHSARFDSSMITCIPVRYCESRTPVTPPLPPIGTPLVPQFTSHHVCTSLGTSLHTNIHTRLVYMVHSTHVMSGTSQSLLLVKSVSRSLNNIIFVAVLRWL
jgi:hypothetical protein